MITALFFESSTPMWVVANESLSILEVNRAAIETYGYKKEHFLRKKLVDLQPQAHISGFKNKEITDKQFEKIGLAHHKDKWGNTHPVKLWGCSIEYEGQNAHLIKADPLDSEWKKSRLNDNSNINLSYHLANIPLAYLVWDQEFRLENFSPKITEWLGYTEDELLGVISTKLAFDYVEHQSFRRVKEKIDALRSGSEKNNNIQIGITSKDGRVKYLHFYNSAQYDDQDKLTSVLTLVENKTEHIQKEKSELRKFQYLTENATDKVAIFDGEANCTYASPSTENLLGYTPEEYISKDIIGLVHPDDRPAIKENLKKLLVGRGKERITYRLKHKKGHYIWIENSLNPVYDNNGNLKEILSAARDVTDNIEQQQRLQKEKRFTEKALNSLPGLFYVLDEEGSYVRINQGFSEELGYSKREIMNMNPLNFYYEDDHQRITKAIQQAFREGQATLTSKIKKKDGGFEWYHITGSHFQQDGEDYILGTGINITKRVKAEQQLEYQSELLNNLFKNAPVGIAMVDSDSEILEVNDSFEEIFGYASSKIVGENINELITPERYRIEQEEIFHDQREGKDSFQYESVRIKKDGTEVPVMIGLVPIIVSKNTTISYIIYVDITERKSYLNQVKQSLEEKRILLHEVHHRVKNNLAIVSSFIQLQKLNTDDEQLRNILSDSEMRIQTMALIHELLYQTESLSEINFEHYIHELIGYIKTTHETNNRITFNINCEEVDLNINQGVPCAMILNELINNSLEHAFKESEKGRIDIILTSSNKNVTVTLQDNGCGLPPDFDKENNDTLGFTIVDTLIQQLEAEADIENNQGTKFTFSFKQADVKGANSSITNAS